MSLSFRTTYCTRVLSRALAARTAAALALAWALAAPLANGRAQLAAGRSETAAVAPINATAPFDAAAFGQTFTHHMATVDGTALHFVRGGRGEPLVLLHGWPQTWYEWRRVMPALAERYTVIAVDLPGLGASGPSSRGYDQEAVGSLIRGLVRQLGYTRINLVGHDWGAPGAYAYAAAHPEEVRRLAIMDVALPGAGLEQSIALSRQPFAWWFTFFQAPEIPEMLVEGRERPFLAAMYNHTLVNKAAVSAADLDEYARWYAAPGGMRAGCNYSRGYLDDVDQTRASMRRKLPMPVLAIGGGNTFGRAVETSLRQVATDVRGVVIPECGHTVAEERPNEFLAALLPFLSDAPATPGARSGR